MLRGIAIIIVTMLLFPFMLVTTLLLRIAWKLVAPLVDEEEKKELFATIEEIEAVVRKLSQPNPIKVSIPRHILTRR